MRATLILSLVVLGSSCGRWVQEESSNSNPVPLTSLPAAPATQTVDAVIENGIPYDACSYPVRVGTKEFAPGATSVTKVAALAPKVGSNPVKITFRETGATATVDCGWGAHRTLPEIEVLSIWAAGLTAEVSVENGLPYDGCSYVITLGTTQLAPSAASVPRVAAFAVAAGKTQAKIEYQLTGNVANVTCGWNSTQSLPEVSVTSIAAP